ncbi:Tfp pilus assembly protein FimT/FimU [Crateriforma spongiae]|uniref:pilus assembly FimT family protein n=1 Tax=Crateriforma spongiae TaxID=2724528 RepID=UPI0039AFBC54
MSIHASRPKHRRAFTLVEIMVVMVLLMLLAGIGLPAIKQTLKDQKESQTSRQVVAYLTTARDRAIATGRPVGVVIERAGTTDPFARSYSTRLRMTNGVPSYGGESPDTRCVIIHDDFVFSTPQVADSNSTTRTGQFNACLFRQEENPLLRLSAQVLNDGDSTNDGAAPIKAGDLISFEGSRPVRIMAIGFSDANDLDLASYGAITPPWNRNNLNYPKWNALPLPALPTDDRPYIKIRFDSRSFVEIGGGAFPTFELPTGAVNATADNTWRASRFQIFRQPSPSQTSPMNLMKGMAIDLNFSGTATYSGGLPAGIEFSPYFIDATAGNVAMNSTDPNNPITFLNIAIVFAPDGSVQSVGSAMPGAAPYAFNERRPTGQIFFLLGKTDGIRPDDPFSTEDRAVSNILDGDSVWIVINPSNGNVAVSPIASTRPVDPNLTIEQNMANAALVARTYAFNSDTLEDL